MYMKIRGTEDSKPNLDSAAEALRQIIDGKDIPSPSSLLRNITADKAAIRLPYFPYSIITNLAHAVFWQNNWLNRLKGIRSRPFTEDWRVPSKEEWDNLRAEFLSGLEEALMLATMKPPNPKMQSDEMAAKVLFELVIHTSYHLGQINLMKRALRLSKKQ
ncbi:MAG TPA: DinB family protein [Fimbriimonadales bacterium]|nr:DinB family protein [Fimbriimonadales bacterium]